MIGNLSKSKVKVERGREATSVGILKGLHQTGNKISPVRQYLK